MLSKELTSTLAISGFAILVFILISQHTEYNSIVRGRLEIKEAFQDSTAPTEVTGSSKTLSAVSPAPADIINQRQPYHLLRGVLPDADKDAPSDLNAERCYDVDFTKRLEKTENYIQRTNNYKRGSPDSCSAPLSVLVNSFYKADPLA